MTFLQLFENDFKAIEESIKTSGLNLVDIHKIGVVDRALSTVGELLKNQKK